MDTVLSRFIDICFGLPFLLGAIVLPGARPPKRNGLDDHARADRCLGWTTSARVMRVA